ncbi:MAG: right-handed parallel beta-helix repeat-containing protein [Solirubrobacterales bacterium]|nr:right-handed parallel beta-helix repeat-containing protein [Solirubrobacterales bacterium]MCB0860264.1 right-handed parallel beta-helix repeat-containing protein [Solirubrobacterales bacterium]
MAAILAGVWSVATGPASADDPYPDPGFPVIPCSSADDTVVLTADAQLDPSCTYTKGVEITASDVTLDCRGASVATEKTKGVGILIETPADQNLDQVTVRNCEVSGFLNGMKITRDGFRDLADGGEYDNWLKDVDLENNTVTGTKGVGIFVDGYVTYTTIRDSVIEGAGSSGIYLEAGSADNTVSDNRIIDNGFGENGPDGQVESFNGVQLRVWGTGREGLSIDGSRRNTVSGNTFEGNSAGGIYLYTNCGEYRNSKPDRYFERRFGATGNLIDGNHLIGGVSGVWVASRMGENILPMECGDTDHAPQYSTGIALDRAADNTISDNDFEDVTYGVRVEDDGTKVTGNSFSGTDAGDYAVMIGTPYRTSLLEQPVSGTELIDNESTIEGNQSPYRWVEGEADTTVSGNTALGEEAGICQSASIPRGPFVMTIAVKPEADPLPPDPLAIPTVGTQEACPQDPPPDEPDDPEPPVVPSNQFQFGKVSLNRKNGSGMIGVKLPGAGKLRLQGTGAVKPQARTVGGAKTVKLTIAARGKAARNLRRKGRVRVKVLVSFTPKGGKARTKSRMVTLVRKKPRHHAGRR